VGPRGLFGVPALRGVVYESAWPMADVAAPPDALMAVALVDPELEIAKRYGVLRVLARLGRAQAFFPTARWCDPARAARMAPEAGSVLDGVAGGFVPGTSVAIQEDRVRLRLPREAQPSLQQFLAALPAGAALGLRGMLPADADACLVWSPGQKGPEAISAPGGRGACIGANFIVFVAEQGADGASPVEDGVVAMLTDASWSRLREALSTGAPLAVPAREPPAKSLALEWC
jgi:hypothetical protein